MPPPADVSVVIATRNRSDELATTLGHLADVPVIVVDNASSDETAQVAAEHGAVVRRLGANLGAAARNIGVAAAETPYIAFADDDSWWAAGSLQRAANLLREHPSVALVTGRVLVGPEERTDPVTEQMAHSPLPPSPVGPSVLGFLACGAMVRKDAFQAVGGFHPRYGIGGEEALLALDLARAGYQLGYAEDVVVHHHPSTSERSPSRRVTESRNAWWTWWLRYPRGLAVRLSVEACRTQEGRAGLLVALRGLPWVLRDRRPVRGALADAVRLLADRRRGC